MNIMPPKRSSILPRLLVVAGLALLAAAATPAHAGLAVSPLKQEISLRPGETGKLTLNLVHRAHNTSEPAEAASLSIMDVSVLVGGELDFKDPGSLKNSASKWITTNLKQVSVDPGKALAIELTITPPPQATPGEYYAAVIVTLANRGHTAKGIEVQYEIASGVFVTVLGQTLPKQAKITSCELQWPPPADPPSAGTPPAEAAETPSAKIAVVLANTGPSRFTATGKLRIIDLAHGRTVMTAVLTNPRPCVFGGDSRRFEAPLTKILPPGKYAVKVDMDYESTWAKAYTTQIIDLTPEQSALLTQIKARQTITPLPLNISPNKFAQIIPVGGSRSLGIGLKSASDVPVRCLLSAASTGDADIESWIALGAEDFNLSPAAHQSVEIKLTVPPDAKPGFYSATLAIESWPEGAELRRTEIPIEIQVKGRGTQP